MSRSRWQATAVLLALIAAGCADGEPLRAAQAQPEATAPAVSSSLTAKLLDEVVPALERAGADDPRLDQVGLTPANDGVIVYRRAVPGADQEWERRYREAAEGYDIRFAAAVLTAAQRRQVERMIEEATPDLRAAGAAVTGFAGGYLGGPTEIVVSPGSNTDPALLERFYVFGRGTVTFLVQDNVQL